VTRHQLRRSTPATNFYGSFLLGNGSLGAAVRGLVGTERIDVNLDTFWSGGPISNTDDSVGDPRQWLAPARKAIAERRFADADTLVTRLQSPRWTQSYQPLGALMWRHTGESASAGDYERVLDLAVAVSTQSRTISGKRSFVTSFVSAPDAVLVV
jgi:alpha-L-fucosidase 2